MVHIFLKHVVNSVISSIFIVQHFEPFAVVCFEKEVQFLLNTGSVLIGLYVKR